MRKHDSALAFAVVVIVVVVAGWLWLWPEQRQGYIAGMAVMGVLVLAWDYLSQDA